MIAIGYICLILTCLLQTQPTGYEAVASKLIECVRENFYDKKRGEAWSRANAEYWTSALDEQDFIRRTRAALAELKASHTAYYTPDDLEYWGLLSVFSGPLKAGDVTYESIGIDVDADRFVRVVFAGGPAAGAGLKRGDRILQVDGTAFHPIRSFRGKADAEVVLAVQRVDGAGPIELRVKPRRIDPRVE